MAGYELLSAYMTEGPRCWLCIEEGRMVVSTPAMSATQARELAAKLTACADEMEAMS